VPRRGLALQGAGERAERSVMVWSPARGSRAPIACTSMTARMPWPACSRARIGVQAGPAAMAASPIAIQNSTVARAGNPWAPRWAMMNVM
jgi:hypothetical protein